MRLLVNHAWFTCWMEEKLPKRKHNYKMFTHTRTGKHKHKFAFAGVVPLSFDHHYMANKRQIFVETVCFVLVSSAYAYVCIVA